MRKRGIEYRHFSAIDSTNAMASRFLAGEVVSEYLVLSTDTQSEGRGQVGTTWQDVPGENLLMTMISPPISWPSRRVFELNMVLSLAVREVLQVYFPVQLKWPNDVLIQERKIAGILIEPIHRGSYVQRLVIGIGLNVNQTEFESGLNATSMKMELNEHLSVMQVKEEVSQKMKDALDTLLATGKSTKSNYLSACLGYGEVCSYEADGQIFPAEFIDVDEIGRQILQLESGEKRTFDLKEVRRVF